MIQNKEGGVINLVPTVGPEDPKPLSPRYHQESMDTSEIHFSSQETRAYSHPFLYCKGLPTEAFDFPGFDAAYTFTKQIQ